LKRNNEEEEEAEEETKEMKKERHTAIFLSLSLQSQENCESRLVLRVQFRGWDLLDDKMLSGDLQEQLVGNLVPLLDTNEHLRLLVSDRQQRINKWLDQRLEEDHVTAHDELKWWVESGQVPLTPVQLLHLWRMLRVPTISCHIHTQQFQHFWAVCQRDCTPKQCQRDPKKSTACTEVKNTLPRPQVIFAVVALQKATQHHGCLPHACTCAVNGEVLHNVDMLATNFKGH